MLPVLLPPTLQVESNYHEQAPENLEEQGQRQGSPVVMPTLRQRLASKAGHALIKAGKKLTTQGMEQAHFSNEPA